MKINEQKKNELVTLQTEWDTLITNYQELNGTKIPFDDFKIAKQIFKE